MGRKVTGRERAAAPGHSRAGGGGRSSKFTGLTRLQRSAGNAAVARLVTVQRHASPSVTDDTEPTAPPPQTLTEEGGGTSSPTEAPQQETPQQETPQQETPAEAPLLGSEGGLGRAGAGSSNVGNVVLAGLSSIRTPARLESKTAGGRFAKEMVTEEHEWATQSGPDARAKALTEMIGRSLSDSGVSPVPGYTLRTDLSPNTLGNFGFSNWRININQKLVSSPTLTSAQADEIANTFYHEGRHCDQWFRMARLRAGQGQKAADIAKSMGIPNNVAASAVNFPLEAGSEEAKEAQVWWDSVYGSHGSDRNKILGELAASDTANAAAAKAYADDHSAANLAAWQAAYARSQKAFAAYQALPEEVSARAAASTMQAALDAARKLNGKDPHDPVPRPPKKKLEGMGDFEMPASTGQGVG